MASSGSFNTTAYSTDYGNACLTFSWSIKSQDATTNQTIINWSVTGAGLNSGHYIKAGGFKVVINGQTVYSKSTDYRIELYTGTVVASGTAPITHTASGSKNFSASVEAGIYYYAVNCSGSGSWELAPILQYPTVSQSEKSVTETTIKMNWSSDSNIDYIWHSTDNGESWDGGYTVTNPKRGVYTIRELSANTDYKVKTRVRSKDTQLITESAALTVRTYDYPHCIEAPEFVIGEPVSLGFYNPLGREFTFNIIANGVQLTHNWTVSGTSYYGLAAESTQNELYESMPDREYASYDVRVTYGDSTRNYEVIDGCRVNPDVCRPTFSNFDYADANADTVNITGNDQLLIKGYSNLVVKIPTEDRMVALNGALPNKYAMDVDTLYQSVDDRDAAIEQPMGAVTTAGVKRINVTAYDSRGLSKTVYKDVTVIEYDEPVINAYIKRLNNSEAQTTLKVSGTYSRVTIDDTDKNSILSAEYRYREIGGEWGESQPLTVTLMSGVFTCNDVVLSLDISKAFEFEIAITDKLETASIMANVGVVQSIFFISTNKKTCYINDVEVPTFNTVYPIGSVYCSSTNTNPSEIYGGTWELIDKGFKSGATIVSQASTEYLSTFRVGSVRGGNTIRLRINGATAQALGDTTTETLGIVDLAQHGLNDADGGFFSYSVYSGVTISDGSNAVMLLYLDSDGELQIADGWTSGGVHSLPSGTPFYFDVTLTVQPSEMLDEFCDKFYWKRTA